MLARQNGGTRAAGRPFPPPLSELTRVAESVLGEPQIGPVFAALLALSAAGPPGPILYRPQFQRPAGAPADPSTLPLLVYLPGIDGTGLAAYRQFQPLSTAFDLRCVFMPPGDRTSFEGLVDSLAKQVQRPRRLGVGR